MAYILNYTIAFTNQITENISVEIYRKDISPPGDIPIALKSTYLSKKFINGTGNRFDCIISSELTIGIFISVNDLVEFDDIAVSFSDEWKVVLKNDSQIDFVGFLVPGECKAAFRDRPYELELTATDALGYLKDIALTDVNGSNFLGTNLLIDYVAACLKKTLLDLDIWVYCNIYESTFFDRNAGNHTSDMFNAAKLDYRTFQQDAITYISCYEALTIMLNNGFNLFQWFGKWVILRCGEMQGVPGPQLWHTEYGPTGNVLTANLTTDLPAQVAKQQILHPVNADQEILSRLANKSVKTNFNYNVWPEIPKNNKFERGSQFEQGDWIDSQDFDDDGDTGEIIGYYKKFNIDDWQYGQVDTTDLPNPAMTTIANRFYRRSNYNFFDTEEERFLVGETIDLSGFNSFWLRCDPVPVQSGSKVKFNVSVRFENDFSANTSTFSLPVSIYLVSDNGDVARLNNLVSGVTQAIGFWKINPPNVFPNLAINYGPNQDTRDWNSLSVETPPMPFKGMLYIALSAEGANTGGFEYYKDVTLEYFPYVAGGYSRVKGDYWKTEQNSSYRDIIDEQAGISDSPIEVLKGALLRNDGVTLTNRTWHRQNVIESRDYKELQNIAHYNAFYRRMLEISGTFGGTTYHPVNNQAIVFPIGFHQHFIFPDSSRLDDKYFQLVPPLEINYVDGLIRATFVECLTTGSNDGDQLGDTHEFKYIF